MELKVNIEFETLMDGCANAIRIEKQKSIWNFKKIFILYLTGCYISSI